MAKSINGFTVAALTAIQAAIINNARANAPGKNDERADERKQIKREVFSAVKARFGIPETTKVKANTTGVDQRGYLVLHDKAGNAFRLGSDGRWDGGMLTPADLFPSAPTAMATALTQAQSVFDAAPKGTPKWYRLDAGDVASALTDDILHDYVALATDDDGDDLDGGDLPTPHLLLNGRDDLAVDSTGTIWRKQ